MTGIRRAGFPAAANSVQVSMWRGWCRRSWANPQPKRQILDARAEFAAAGHPARRIPVIGIFERGIDVVADRGIQRPGFSQCRIAQMFGNAFAQKRGDIGASVSSSSLGRLERSNSGVGVSTSATGPDGTIGASATGASGFGSGCFASCLRCDHRARKPLSCRPGPDHSCAACSLIRPTARHSRAIAARAIPLALVEHALDMEFIDKGRDP